MSRANLLLAAVAGLGLVACQDAGPTRRIELAMPASVPADTFSYMVTDTVDEGAEVRYEVVTSAGDTRYLRYDDRGLRAVESETGEIVAGHNVTTGTAADRLLGKLELWSDPVVGYQALGLDQPLPQPVEAPDAVLPDALQTPYAAGCTRTSLGTWQSGGCTQGGYVDVCGDTTYLLYYQKASGCILGFFCDCDAISGAIEI
ncbi:MAG: hypothetical protein JNK64_17485 [Myxococcales bacterium]|nr:hypothetical protein [Myxococcales bacterium]